MKIILIYILTFFSLAYPQERWKKLNGPMGGEVGGLLAKSDTLVVSVSTKAKVFYSTNGGEEWKPAGKFGTYFIDFVQTDDGAIIGAHRKAGVYKSYDLKTWTQVYYGNNDDFWSVGKDKNGVLYAGTELGKIYKSTNNGLNWTLSLNSGSYRIQGSETMGDYIYFGSRNRIYRKHIDSSSWDVNILNPTTAQSYKPFSDDEGNIFAHSSSRIFISSDSGSTWEQREFSSFFHGNYWYNAIYNKKIIAGFGDETGWFGDGWGVALSNDKGISWRWTHAGFPSKVSSIYQLKKSGYNTYAGTNAAGVFKSTDYGESWFPINNGITAALTYDITFDSEGTIYAASWSNFLQKSTDKGETWVNLSNGFTNSYFSTIIADDNDNLLAGTTQGIFRSTDKGESWIRVANAGSIPWRFVKDNNNRIYCVGYSAGIYRTTDLGANWTRIDNDFSNPETGGFVIDKSGNLYAGTRGGVIYKSTNDGVSWNVVRNSVPNTLISRMGVSPAGNVFAVSEREGILRSTDKGVSWQNINSTINMNNFGAFGINGKGEIFAGTADGKVFYSNDEGITWHNYTSNLNMISFQSLTFDKEDNVYLATNESIWKSNPDSVVSVAENPEIPAEYKLYQNYPNPFNPTTIIKYAVKEAGMVLLTVYDILGKEITTLVNETKSPGEYTATFDASPLPSGIYFYTMQAGGFSATKKLLLLK